MLLSLDVGLAEFIKNCTTLVSKNYFCIGLIGFIFLLVDNVCYVGWYQAHKMTFFEYIKTMNNMGSVFKGKNKIAVSAKVVNCFVENSIICENVEIYNSVIKDSVIKDGAVVGPFAHIRDGAVSRNKK